MTNLRPILRGPDLSDEDLIKYVNELDSNQEERQSKLGSGQPKAAKVNATKVAPASGPTQQIRAQDGQFLAEIREMHFEISALKQNVYNHRSPRSRPRGRGPKQRPWTKDWGTPVNIAINVDYPSILNSIVRTYSSRKTGTSCSQGTKSNWGS